MLTVDIVERMKPKQLISHYMLASFAYYRLNRSPMTDEAFDRLCQRIIHHWKTIDHQHKPYVDLEGLRAGTGYYLNKYPLIVACAADAYCRGCEDGSLIDALQNILEPAPVKAGTASTSKRIVRAPRAPSVSGKVEPTHTHSRRIVRSRAA